MPRDSGMFVRWVEWNVRTRTLWLIDQIGRYDHPQHPSWVYSWTLCWTLIRPRRLLAKGNAAILLD